MSMQPYSEYSDSGVEWLGHLPAHWKVKRLKYALRLKTEKTSRRMNPVALENIEGWSGRFVATESEYDGEGVAFDVGDILFGKLRPYLAKVYRANISGEAVGDFHVLSPSREIESRYAQYQILNRAFISVIDGSTYGAKMPRVSWDFMANLPFILPSITEQIAISDFLDRETKKIDLLVKEQEQLVELLKERCRAIVTNAVTGRLNHGAKMKGSGVHWLGDIPAHWEIKRIKRLTKMISKGTTPTTIGAEFVSEGVRFLKAENIQNGLVVTEPEFFIDVDTHHSLSRSNLISGDVLVVIAGATTGKSAILSVDLTPANTNQAVSFVRPIDKNYSVFIHHWLSTQGVQDSIKLAAVQSAQPNLSMEDLGNIPIPVPPKDELEQIVELVEALYEKTKTSIHHSESAIALLRERRIALISAAVTGKIDTRKILISPQKQQHGQDVFRSVVAFSIILKFSHRQNFGRVKLQKFLYLAEAYANVSELAGSYDREAAGPLDRSMLSEVEAGLQDTGSVSVEQPNGRGGHVVYKVLKRENQATDVLASVLGERKQKFDHLLSELGDLDTKTVEAVTTLFAVWNDFLIDGRTPTEAEIVSGVLNEWHPEKRDKFTIDELRKWLAWMRRREIVPNKQGPRTTAKRLFL